MSSPVLISTPISGLVARWGQGSPTGMCADHVREVTRGPDGGELPGPRTGPCLGPRFLVVDVVEMTVRFATWNQVTGTTTARLTNRTGDRTRLIQSCPYDQTAPAS
jgi:hypothetical protein